MNKLKTTFLICLLFMIFSCKKDNNEIKEKDEEIENNSTYNNSAIIIGSKIGLGSEDLANIWKTSKVIVEVSSNEFVVDTIYFSRSSITSNFTYWIMPVINVSEDAHSFIKATGIQYLDSNNNVVYEDESNYTYVEGSCASLSNSTIMTNSFLRAGETGYFIGIDEVSFDHIDKIKFSSIEYSENDLTYSSINVVPLSYGISNDIINVTIENQSDKEVFIWMSPYLLLDRNNKPLNWSYLSPTLTGTSFELYLQSGAPGKLKDYDFYQGTCNKIRPILSINLESMDYGALITNGSKNSSKEEILRNFKKNRDMIIKAQELH